MQSDIVFGSNLGDISILTGKKYFVLIQKAHQDCINTLKVTSSFAQVISCDNIIGISLSQL
jgi:hypothetical protein